VGAFDFSSMLRSAWCDSLTIRFTAEGRMLGGCSYNLLRVSGSAVNFDVDKHGIKPKSKECEGGMV